MSEAEIVSPLLALSPKKRAEIAGVLLRSLDVDDSDEMEGAWIKEIERRVEDVRNGAVRTIPGDQAMKNLRRKLRNKRTSNRK